MRRRERSTTTDPTRAEVVLPSVATQRWITLLILFQFACLVLSLASNLSPSALEGRLLQWLSPYLVTTAQDYIIQPLELTHAGPLDTQLLVQVQYDSPEWKVVTASGSKLSTSMWPNMSRLVRWIAESQADAPVLAEVAHSWVRVAELDSNKLPTAVRLYAPHVYSYDEDQLVAADQDQLVEEAFAGTVVYEAAVVRDEDGNAVIVPRQDASMTSKPVDKDRS